MLRLFQTIVLALLVVPAISCSTPARHSDSAAANTFRDFTVVFAHRAADTQEFPRLRMLHVLDGAVDLLFDAGFAIQSPVPPFRSKHGFSSLYAPSESLYYNTTFFWGDYVGCTVGFDSQNVAVSFADSSEWVSFPPSRHADDAQRQKIRVLARHMASYLRAHLPTYYHITTSFPDDGLTTRSSKPPLRSGR